MDARSRKCGVDGCTTQPSFGIKGRPATRCARHKTDDMVDARGRECGVDGCTTQPHFGIEGHPATRCARHKTDDMVNVLSCECGVDGCTTHPSFGIEGCPATRCARHKTDDMANVLSRKCGVDGCTTQPSFGIKGCPATRCARHKTDDMVNVLSRKCGEDGCKVRPSFGPEGGPATRCAMHKTDDMVNVLSRECGVDGCKVRPSFGPEGGPATRCAMHKTDDMVDVRGGKCTHPNCAAKKPLWGKLRKDGKPDRGKRYCNDHYDWEPGLINLAEHMRDRECRRLSDLTDSAADDLDALPKAHKDEIVAKIVAWVREVLRVHKHASIYICVSHWFRIIEEIGRTPFTNGYFVDEGGNPLTTKDLSLAKAINDLGAKQEVLAVTVRPEDANDIEKAVHQQLHYELTPRLSADDRPDGHRLWRKEGTGGTRVPRLIPPEVARRCVRYVVGAFVIPDGDPPSTAFALSGKDTDLHEAAQRARANHYQPLQRVVHLPVPPLSYLPAGISRQIGGGRVLPDTAAHSNKLRQLMVKIGTDGLPMYLRLRAFVSATGTETERDDVEEESANSDEDIDLEAALEEQDDAGMDEESGSGAEDMDEWHDTEAGPSNGEATSWEKPN